LAAVFILVLPLSILAFDLGRGVFNPPLMKTVLTEIVTESELIPVALDWYSDRRAEERYAAGEAQAWVGEPDVVQLMDFMGLNDWIKIRDIALPDEILAGWVSDSVDGTYAWVDNDDRVPQIIWEMEPFIAHVDGEPGLQSIQIAYAALPPCNAEQIADFEARLAAAPAGTEVLYNLCEFPDPWYEDQFSDYLESLQDLIDNIPLKFELTDELAQVEDTTGVGPERLKSQARTIRFWMQWAFLIPVVLVVLILLLGVRNLRSLARWVGIPLIAGGVIALLLALLHSALITALLSFGVLSEIPELVISEVTKAILILAGYVFRPMVWQALLIVVLGGVLVLIGYLRKAPQEPEPVDVA
jgi:hypothetical protein